MKRCRRCNSASLHMVRESAARRGSYGYMMCWFRCGECHEVSLAYRRIPEVPEAAIPAAVDGAVDAVDANFPRPEGEPALSH